MILVYLMFGTLVGISSFVTTLIMGASLLQALAIYSLSGTLAVLLMASIVALIPETPGNRMKKLSDVPGFIPDRRFDFEDEPRLATHARPEGLQPALAD